METSGQGLARGLRFVDPITRQVVAVADKLKLDVGGISSPRLASGAVKVKATVFSPLGPPSVTLDDTWPVTVTPGAEPPSYEVAFLLGDPSAAPHTLDIRVGDEAERRTFTPEPDPRVTTLDPRAHGSRALIIGNSRYTRPGVPLLPGAATDATNVHRAFAHPDSWKLTADRVTAPKDLNAADLATAIKAFFRNAQPGETLLLYYAGHGLTAGGKGYLVGVDYDPAATEPLNGAVPAKVLWDAVKTSPAAQVLVVLDACRSGALLFPQTEAARAEVIDRLGVLTATSAGANAAGNAGGGLFTQAFVTALTAPPGVTLQRGSVTLQAAYRYILGTNAGAQNPRLFGALDAQVLSTPPLRVRAGAAVTLRATGDGDRSAVRAARATLVTESRQVTGDPTLYEKDGQYAVKLDVTFGHDTRSLRVRVGRQGDKRPTGEKIWYGLWGEGTEDTFHVDLLGPRPGEYEVELTPCRPRRPCDKERPERLERTLPIGVQGRP